MQMQTTRNKGFTLFELLVVVAILIALAGIITPYVLNILENSRLTALQKLIGDLTQAIQDYRSDLLMANPSLDKDNKLSLPIENSSVAAETSHMLYFAAGAQAAGLKGWNGPYINKPLSSADNPWGGEIGIVNDFADLVMLFPFQPSITGGAGSPTATGAGAALVLTGLSPTEIQAVNEMIDLGKDGALGLFAGRAAQGSCPSLFPTATGTLNIFLLDLDGK